MDTPTFDDRPIWDVWLSVYWAPSMVAADELGLFDALAAAPAGVEEIASGLALNPVALKALLPMLASLGLLQVRLGRYQLSGAGRSYLVKSSPLYWGHAFSIHRRSALASRIEAALRSRPVESLDVLGERERPVDSWESGELDPQMARMLTAFMHSHSLPAALGLAASPRFEKAVRVLDVGGGSGCFSIALAERRPALRCTVMELPVVCELARGYVEAAGVQMRVDLLARDMFREAWPQGHDAVLMSNIFHDWEEATCARLAASAFDALPSGGRIHLHEMLIDDEGSGPLPSAAFSMQMLVGTKGRQYSAAELAGLLQGAGFSDVAVDPAYGYFSLVTAVRP
jgi:acetylserotonin N-methyltransferase